MPLDRQKYEQLTEDEIEHIDQFLFRFAKLQDAMGQKLFKNIMLFLDEEIENKPFIDILNRMEKQDSFPVPKLGESYERIVMNWLITMKKTLKL